MSANGNISASTGTELARSVVSLQEFLAALGTTLMTASVATPDRRVQGLENNVALTASDPLKAVRHSRFANQFGVVFPELRVCLAVANATERCEIAEFVGVNVVVEKDEGALVVDRQSRLRSALLAFVAIAPHRCFLLLGPVRPSVVSVSSAPCWILVAAHVILHELNAALFAAEVSRLDLTAIFENRLAAAEANSLDFAS